VFDPNKRWPGVLGKNRRERIDLAVQEIAGLDKPSLAGRQGPAHRAGRDGCGPAAAQEALWDSRTRAVARSFWRQQDRQFVSRKITVEVPRLLSRAMFRLPDHPGHEGPARH